MSMTRSASGLKIACSRDRQAESLRQDRICLSIPLGWQDAVLLSGRTTYVSCAFQNVQCALICSIEVRRNTGTLLGRAVYHKEEENRGVVRNELVLALADALPKGCLHLGCNIESVTIDADGENSSMLPYAVFLGAVCARPGRDGSSQESRRPSAGIWEQWARNRSH